MLSLRNSLGDRDQHGLESLMDRGVTRVPVVTEVGVLTSPPQHLACGAHSESSVPPPLPAQVLICRNYRGDVDMSEVEHFMPILMEKEEEGMLSPILAHGGVRFMWIKHNNLYRIPLRGSSQGPPVCARTHGQPRASRTRPRLAPGWLRHPLPELPAA